MKKNIFFQLICLLCLNNETSLAQTYRFSGTDKERYSTTVHTCIVEISDGILNWEATNKIYSEGTLTEDITADYSINISDICEISIYQTGNRGIHSPDAQIWIKAHKADNPDTYTFNGQWDVNSETDGKIKFYSGNLLEIYPDCIKMRISHYFPEETTPLYNRLLEILKETPNASFEYHGLDDNNATYHTIGEPNIPNCIFTTSSATNNTTNQEQNSSKKQATDADEQKTEDNSELTDVDANSDDILSADNPDQQEEPTVDNEEPTVDNEEPTVDNEEPTVDNEEPTLDDEEILGKIKDQRALLLNSKMEQEQSLNESIAFAQRSSSSKYCPEPSSFFLNVENWPLNQNQKNKYSFEEKVPWSEEISLAPGLFFKYSKTAQSVHPGQKAIRGLFVGPTFVDQGMTVVEDMMDAFFDYGFYSFRSTIRGSAGGRLEFTYKDEEGKLHKSGASFFLKDGEWDEDMGNWYPGCTIVSIDVLEFCVYTE